MKSSYLMNIIACFLFLFTLSIQAQTPAFSLQDLEGTWYVKATNFPMWLKGKKTNPTFDYTVIEKKGKQILLDEVHFLKNGKEKVIVGYDYPQNKINSKFVWRGKGLLAIVKSKWEIILMDEQQEWAVIQFEKTLFTPAGIDIIFREKEPDNALREQLLAKLLTRNIVEDKGGLSWL